MVGQDFKVTVKLEVAEIPKIVAIFPKKNVVSVSFERSEGKR